MKKDAKKTGFSKDLLKTCKGDFKTFEAWFNEKYEGLKAADVWKQLGGQVPKKEAKK